MNILIFIGLGLMVVAGLVLLFWLSGVVDEINRNSHDFYSSPFDEDDN